MRAVLNGLMILGLSMAFAAPAMAQGSAAPTKCKDGMVYDEAAKKCVSKRGS